jgi:hypothetical protein
MIVQRQQRASPSPGFARQILAGPGSATNSLPGLPDRRHRCDDPATLLTAGRALAPLRLNST